MEKKVDLNRSLQHAVFCVCLACFHQQSIVPKRGHKIPSPALEEQAHLM